jgi:mannobiose 2-epimerase
VNAIDLKDELSIELERILTSRMENSIDSVHGGFIGEMDNQNRVKANSSKGTVLNARILWSFSAAYRVTAKPCYLPVAERAYHYIVSDFIDHDYGGVFWELDAAGNVLNDSKQIYAIASPCNGVSIHFRDARADFPQNELNM